MKVQIKIQNATIYVNLDSKAARTDSTSPPRVLGAQSTCPTLGQHINVQSASGSGSSGTICASISYSGPTLPTSVYAQVIANPTGAVPPTTVNFPGTGPGGAMLYQHQVSNTFYWDALPSAITAAPSSGAPTNFNNYIAFWSSGTPGCPSDMVIGFVGVASGGSTCCSGSSSTGRAVTTAHDLTHAAHLNVYIPEGANAGMHTARAIGSMRWRVTIGGIHYTLAMCSSTGSLKIEGPLGAAAATSQGTEPFHALFDGAIFGSRNSIMVTK